MYRTYYFWAVEFSLRQYSSICVTLNICSTRCLYLWFTLVSELLRILIAWFTIEWHVIQVIPHQFIKSGARDEVKMIMRHVCFLTMTPNCNVDIPQFFNLCHSWHSIDFNMFPANHSTCLTILFFIRVVQFCHTNATCLCW